VVKNLIRIRVISGESAQLKADYVLFACHAVARSIMAQGEGG